MPSPTTALQIIEDALGLSSSVGVDQTLTNDEQSDCLRKLNDLIEILSISRLAVYGQSTQTFNTAAATKTYTIGPAGTWNTVRPVRIREPGYTVIGGVSFPCVSIEQEQYNLIADKNMPQDFPEYYLYVNDSPLGSVTLWPVPTGIVPITLSIDRVLTQVTTAATVISLPPGYAHMFTNILAVWLAPLFGKQAPPDVKDIARQALADIKRANKRPVLLGYDPALTGNGFSNWRSG